MITAFAVVNRDGLAVFKDRAAAELYAADRRGVVRELIDAEVVNARIDELERTLENVRAILADQGCVSEAPSDPRPDARCPIQACGFAGECIRRRR